MTDISSLSLAELRELNELLALSNRKSKDANVQQMIIHMKDTYGYYGPYTDQAIKETVAKGIPAVLPSHTTDTDTNVSIDNDKLIADLIAKGIVKPSALGNPDSKLQETIEKLYHDGIIDINAYGKCEEDYDIEDTEEEEDPDPAQRYGERDSDDPEIGEEEDTEEDSEEEDHDDPPDEDTEEEEEEEE